MTAYRPKSNRPRAGRREGVTLTELMIAFILLSIAILALSGVMVSVNQHHQANTQRYQCLKRAQSVLEEIGGQSPATIVATYDGATYPVSGVKGVDAPDRVLTVDVDDTDPKLLVITIEGSWFGPAGEESLALRSEVFDSEG